MAAATRGLMYRMPVSFETCQNREEFIIWPKYKQAYIRAFDRMLEERRRRGKMDGGMRWGDNGLDIFNWWMENDVLPGQEVLEEFREDLL